MIRHEHVWIEGPELPRRYGSCLSRICTECGVYEAYDWYGKPLYKDYYIDAAEWWQERDDTL